MVEDKGKQITEVTYSNVQSVCLDEIVEECLKFTKTRNARISIVELPFTKEKIIKIYTEEKN